MRKTRAVGRLFTTVAVVGLITVVPGVGNSGWSAESLSSTRPSADTLSVQQAALGALAEAHKAVRRGNGHNALEQIERAETALLNLEQARADPRIEDSLLRLDLARAAIGRNANRVADELLASAAHTLTGAFAVAAAAMPPGTSPMSEAVRPDQVRASRMIGEPVYDADDRAIGSVVDLVLDPDGTVDAVVIGLPDAAGVVIKTVAVPMTELKTSNNRRGVERTRDQMQQSGAYRLDAMGTPNTSGGSGATAPPGSGARR